MNLFVLDNSVAMRWLLKSEKPAGQEYAETVLKRLSDHTALVPNLWRLEAANVLLNAQKKHDITGVETERFISQLEKLPIQVDPETDRQALGRTFALAKTYKLSSYDAAYLELAVRENLALATLDMYLLKASKKANVDIFSLSE